MHKSESAQENETPEKLKDFEMQTGRPIPARRLELIK